MKNQGISFIIATVLCVTIFTILDIKPVAASGETIIGSLEIDDANFLRCYDWSVEQVCTGYPSNDVYDTAYLTAYLPPYQEGLYDNQVLQARLHKVLEIDGVVVANGLTVTIPAEGPYSPLFFPISRQGGAIWVEDQLFAYDKLYGSELYFEYDLSFDSLCYGYDQFPNYWTTQHFIDQKNGHVWNGHTYRISFAVEWFEVIYTYPPQYVKFGATDDIPDQYRPHGFSVGTSHYEEGWESWVWMLPDDEIHFACSTAWSETYGSASITGLYDAQFRTPDNNYATLIASSPGSFARSVYWMGGTTAGQVWVHSNSLNSPFSRFLVYVSIDNDNWRFSSEQFVYNGGDRWIDCGTPNGTYAYVMVVAYNSGITSYMKVNCVHCGSHY